MSRGLKTKRSSSQAQSKEEFEDEAAEAAELRRLLMDGAETLRGLYPVETISTVGRICVEDEKVFNYDVFLRRLSNLLENPCLTWNLLLLQRYMYTHVNHIDDCLQSIVQQCLFCLLWFPSLKRINFVGHSLVLLKYVSYTYDIHLISSFLLRNNQRGIVFVHDVNQQARQSLIVGGLFPMLADPRHPAGSNNVTNETMLKVALDYGKAMGIIKPHDGVVVFQEVVDASVVKIIELKN